MADSPPQVSEADRALGQRFHAGDRAAFTALVTPHVDTLYTLCLRMTANVAEAEDLAQESLVRALRQHAAYDPERAFRPWLLAIASNLCRDRLRSAWWRRMVNAEPLPEASDTDVEGAVLGKESDEQVRRALASLPALYREALSLYHLGDMSYREMETITGAAIPALKQRVRRGTAMLQKAMQRLYPHLVARRILSDDEPEA